ncbi:uncharacterized protein BX664DRAFT_326795 [Halteromyces radiatus]|uniref:uncharacterized protein n=1 Tax=Halteromyces radiatus TaxID=101107 RepID=UPI00221EBCC6|nr:uncharacterized protein BX664DRAFT_326795 [Halteromyces radiatus]KAI8097609.1 hypothetical protein BX664DRAFT_326795 [Halteromyces radiatus]
MDEFTRPSEEVIKQWQDQLLGKYILEPNEPLDGLTEDEVVRSNTLRQPVQVLPPGAPMIRNLVPGRMNVFIDDNKKTTQVYFG